MKGPGIAGIDFDPEKVKRFHCPRHLDVALGLIVKVQVDHDVNVRANRLPEGCQLVLDGTDRVPLRVQLWKAIPPSKAGDMTTRIIVSQKQDVGFERRVASGDHFPSGCEDIIQGFDRGDAHRLPMRYPVRGTVRPVQADSIAYRSAEHLVNRNAERTGLHVKQGIFYRTDCLLDCAPRCLAAQRVQQRNVCFVVAGVLANQDWGEVVDERGHAGAAKGLVEFAPSDNAFVGGDFQEIQRAPCAVRMQALDFCDLHL